MGGNGGGGGDGGGGNGGALKQTVAREAVKRTVTCVGCMEWTEVITNSFNNLASMRAPVDSSDFSH